jgi:DNA-directed RNA polymerase subunit E'/Rpb7
MNKFKIYESALIAKSISLPMNLVGSNLMEIIRQEIANSVEAKCIVEGFVKPNSTKIISFSSGIVKADTVLFDIVFECQIFFPVEGMLLQCIAKNITKAGIKAESIDNNPSPFIVFVSRDHQNMDPEFLAITENAVFTARVIGQRFELHDKYVSIIAELVPSKERFKQRPIKAGSAPKLVLN